MRPKRSGTVCAQHPSRRSGKRFLTPLLQTRARMMNLRRQGMLLFLSLTLIGCVETPEVKGREVVIVGFNDVLLVPEEESQRNDHPVTLTPTEIGTLLHRVLYSERRNFLSRLISGDALKRRAFRSDDIAFLAPALSQALAQATPDERVFFHLSRPGTGAGEKGTTPTQTGMPGVAMGRPVIIGGEESTSGWIFVRGPLLHLVLSEVQYVHGPAPDIGQYVREMQNVPKVPTGFTLAFDPETYAVTESSWGGWLAPSPLEALAIRFRDALADLPPYKILEGGEPASP